MYAYTSFSNGTPTGFDAVSDGFGVDAAGTADEIPFVSGSKYLVTFNLTLNSGTAPTYIIASFIKGGIVCSDVPQQAVAGSNSFIFTCNLSSTGVCYWTNNNTATDFSLTNISITNYYF